VAAANEVRRLEYHDFSRNGQPSVLFPNGDNLRKKNQAKIKIKQQPRPRIARLWPSQILVQTLLKHDLVDCVLAEDISDNVGRWGENDFVCLEWHDIPAASRWTESNRFHSKRPSSS